MWYYNKRYRIYWWLLIGTTFATVGHFIVVCTVFPSGGRVRLHVTNCNKKEEANAGKGSDQRWLFKIQSRKSKLMVIKRWKKYFLIFWCRKTVPLEMLGKIITSFHCLSSLDSSHWYFRCSFQGARYSRYLLSAKYATDYSRGLLCCHNFWLVDAHALMLLASATYWYQSVYNSSPPCCQYLHEVFCPAKTVKAIN